MRSASVYNKPHDCCCFSSFLVLALAIAITAAIASSNKIKIIDMNYSDNGTY